MNGSKSPLQYAKDGFQSGELVQCEYCMKIFPEQQAEEYGIGCDTSVKVCPECSIND